MNSPYTTFGLPNDPVALSAFGLGLVGLFVAALWRRPLVERIDKLPAWAVVGALSLAATLLSLGYVAYYLRGGPRIIDATSYFLQARTFAEGAASFAVPDPSGSFRGRFLVPTPDGALSVIFPPGYPALLALGFVVRTPLVIGPLLAGALVYATYDLTKRLSGQENVARVAALLSVLCATLRYHTADTMSHGLAALLLTLGIAVICRPASWAPAAGGLIVGWLVASRPVTGAVAVVLALALLAAQPRRIVGFGLGLVPGFAALLGHQRAVTGEFFGSTQLRYYALADGPPGCFRYGFGRGIGCLFEHGEFVRARLGDGYGAVEALGNTIRRLAVHAMDIENAFPLAGVVLYAAWVVRKQPRLRVLAVGPLALIAAYAPFYFDGSYPGGGARLFAEALPLEHALLAFGLVRLGAARFALPMALLGFALHQSHAHVALRDREGGRPMFEQRAVTQAGVSSGLIFVGTDHGFNLGHAPGQRGVANTLVARLRGDAHDFVLWEHLGRPPAFRYDFDPGSALATPHLVRFTPEPSSRFEAEAEWPPLSVRGWAHPDHSPCASGGRALRVRSTGATSAVTLAVQAREPGPHALRVGWVRAGRFAPELRIRQGSVALAARSTDPEESPCGVSNAGPFDLAAGQALIEIEAKGGALLDYIELERGATNAY